MKKTTIAVLIAAGCATYLLTKKNKVQESPQTTGETSKQETPKNQEILPDPVQKLAYFQKGDQVLHWGVKKTVLSNNHPIYTVMDANFRKANVNVNELTPA